ncbi:hypothetical protein ACP4OV_005602 [Aristida adscensionis]
MEDETHPSEVVVDRSVHFIDEVVEEIERAGAPALDDTLDEILAGIQASCSGSSSDLVDAEQAALRAELLRYRVEVEEPAAAALRDLRAFSPSPVGRDTAVPFTGGVPGCLHREVLRGVEPVVEVAAPPALTSLVLRVSWPRDFALRYHGGQSFVSSSDGNLLALYVGWYRPGLGNHYPGCYLVYDAWANSVAAIPRLPPCFLSSMHLSVGGGVAVQRHREPSDYVLAELLRLGSDDDDDNDVVCCGGGATSCKADLFLWWSSGACAGRWTQKPVELPPLPKEPGWDASFHADMVQAAGRTRLCWIDLFQGTLICDDVLADRPRFRFAALPEECFVKQGHMDRMHPELSRSACCVERRDGRWTLEFLAMDSHGRGLDCPLQDQPCQKCRRKGRRDCPREDHPQDCPLHSWTLTTWSMILQDPCEQQQQLEWEKGSSVCLGEVIKDPDLQAMQPQVPVLSMAEEGVVYLVLSDLFMSRDYCLFKIDVKLQRVLCRTDRLPCAEDAYFPHPFVLGSQFNTYLNRRNQWSEAQQKRDAEVVSDEKLPWISASCCGRRPPPGINNILGLASLLDA